jgi:hypothetical protein
VLSSALLYRLVGRSRGINGSSRRLILAVAVSVAASEPMWSWPMILLLLLAGAFLRAAESFAALAAGEPGAGRAGF